MNCLILRGLPGSGKSTLAKKHDGAVICSADAYFEVDGEYRFDPKRLGEAHQACFRRFMEALIRSESLVVVDNTNIEAWQMAPYVLAAQAWGYQVQILEIPAEVEVCVARNIHSVPEGAIRRMADALRQPLPFPWQSLVRCSS